ncbi:unnamed protein product [Closterium sp. NIES-53]
MRALSRRLVTTNSKVCNSVTSGPLRANITVSSGSRSSGDTGRVIEKGYPIPRVTLKKELQVVNPHIKVNCTPLSIKGRRDNGDDDDDNDDDDNDDDDDDDDDDTDRDDKSGNYDSPHYSARSSSVLLYPRSTSLHPSSFPHVRGKFVSIGFSPVPLLPPRDRQAMDAMAARLQSSFDEVLASASLLVEAASSAPRGDAQSGSSAPRSEVAVASALEVFQSRVDLFQAACDRAQQQVDAARHRLLSESLVDEARGAAVDTSAVGAAGGEGETQMVLGATRLEQISKAVRAMVQDLQHGHTDKH